MTPKQEEIRRGLLDEKDALEDEIACAEHDIDMDGDTEFDIDTAFCRIADIDCDLEEMDQDNG